MKAGRLRGGICVSDMHTCCSTAGYRIYIVSPWIQAYDEPEVCEEIGGLDESFAQGQLHRGGLLPFNLQLDIGTCYGGCGSRKFRVRPVSAGAGTYTARLG